MGIFSFFKKEEDPENIDYMSIAQNFENKGDFSSAIAEYEKLISIMYKNKPESMFRHIRKKIINCYINLGDYDKVFELWNTQYNTAYYGAKEIYDLIKILEQGQRIDLVMKAYDLGGKKLWPNKIEFLIKNKKIPEANSLLNELLSTAREGDPALPNLWMTKAKLSMSLLKWEEANRFLNKILEKNQHNSEARKLKEFCLKQIKNE